MLADVMTRTLLPLQSATRRLVQPGGRGRGWGVGILSLFHHQDRMRVHTALALNDSRKLQFSTDLLPPLPEFPLLRSSLNSHADAQTRANKVIQSPL